MANVLILGCGYVGATLGVALGENGHHVWGMRRTPGEVLPPIRPLATDVNDEKLAGLLPKNLDFVFYTISSGGGGEAGYRAAYAQGPANLLRALDATGEKPRRIFFTSSTAVYAQTDGGWVDEESPTQPTSYTGRILLEGERIFLNCEHPATIVRLGGIYGPGRTRLMDSVRKGRAEIQEGPPRFTNRIHRDDCAGVLAHLMRMDTPDSIYVGVDDEPADRRVVFHWLADRLGVARPREVGAARRASGRAATNKRCANARLKATGYRFRYPTFREGYAEMIQAAKSAL